MSVSTPTGSTAYNKSIGGAVMHPRVHAFQVTEVAPLNNLVYRTLGAPMIIAEKDTVTIDLKNADDYLLTVDQLEYFYDQIASVTYSLDGGEISFVNGGHTGFWHRVKNAFIGEVVEIRFHRNADASRCALKNLAQTTRYFEKFTG